MSDKKCEGCGKPATGTDPDDVPLCDACGEASDKDAPPAPGPAFHAEGFLFRYAEDVCECCDGESVDLTRLDDLQKKYVAELRAALGTVAGDEGEAVTEEWLRSVGFTNAPNSAYVRIASKDNAVAVRLATGEVEIYDNESLEMCRVHGMTRGRLRMLCTALGIPLPAPTKGKVIDAQTNSTSPHEGLANAGRSREG